MTNPHVSALVALLAPVVPVYVSRAPDATPYPYVVLHPTRGLARTTALDNTAAGRTCRFMTHCYGTGWEQADYLAGRVSGALLKVRPVVAGRKASPISHESEFGIDRDEDMPTPVFMARDVWTFESHLA